MKRKRGNKKGRAKKPKLVSTNEVASNVVSLNTEENSGVDEFDNEEVDSGMDAETEATPSPSATSQPEVLANANSVGRPINSTFGRAVYTRVKVKIKTSKNLESQHTSSDAPTQSDTDKSSQQVGSEKQEGPSEKMEDSANSLSETNGGVSGNTLKKSMGIKIKSSRGLGSSSMSPCSNIEPVKTDTTEKKDAESLHQESRYNEQELKASLEVIRKVMKMDAAEPFNVPVNPVALGIPVSRAFLCISVAVDGSPVGVKYKNSEDVFKDVQYIWDNCYKYNNKGDYIVELMKRVKKNFTKYWTTAGLFNDQPQETSGLEGNPVADLTPSSEGNTPVNGGALILSGKSSTGLRVGLRHGHSNLQFCFCNSDHTWQLHLKILVKGIAHGESPFGEYASSNIENSPDADIERKEDEIGTYQKFLCSAEWG
ncbi:UNVERIFIED_CONTAM: hypothetical protein Scaly_1406000 [Sesamum calycinum]|uniref:Bromo domain-containing protein n=1 Tax=Sesamum calycinum TaxID=2727403 RepID=A0AAW2PQB3_9LAMI